MHNTSLFSISLLICVISWLLDDSHSNRCEMISNCCFDMHFMMISDVKQFMGRKELDTTERLNWTELKHLYMNLLEFCTSSLEKYVLNSSAHYLSQMVCILILIYMNLYIFWILIYIPGYRYAGKSRSLLVAVTTTSDFHPSLLFLSPDSCMAVVYHFRQRRWWLGKNKA